MIRVTVELLPLGGELCKKHLGTAIIANNLTGTRESGNYNVKLSKIGRPGQTWKKATIEGFPRLSTKYGAWDLLLWALIAVVGNRVAKMKATD